MPEKDTTSEVVEFKGESTGTTATIGKDNVPIKATTDAAKPITKVPVVPSESSEPKPFTWQGVKFPAYFKGPHFIQIKGSIVLAIDPDCVSMEMRTNWQNIYVPELAALGKKIIEKHLKIKIEKLD